VQGMVIHLVFDLLAALSATTLTGIIYNWRLKGGAADPQGQISRTYLAALIAGAVIGGYGFGTGNLWLSGHNEIGRSILGALAGGIAAIESYKWTHRIRRSTGLIFVGAFAASVTVGRIGCLMAGFDDQTFGAPTGYGWGWDFGDGIPRHPVQLYESAAMAVFLVYALWAFWRRQPFFMRNGFYLLVAVYALQRFLWEFLKPYATVLGPLNIFHILCLVLIAYSAYMIVRERRLEHASA